MSGSTVTIAGKQGFVNFCIVSRTQFSHTSYIIILKFLLHGLYLPVKTPVILSRKSLNLKDVRNPREPRWNAITGGQLHCCERKRIRGMTSYLKRVKEEQYLWGVLIHFFSSVSEKKNSDTWPKGDSYISPSTAALNPLGRGWDFCTRVTATFFTIKGNSMDFAEVNDPLSRPLYERASAFPWFPHPPV